MKISVFVEFILEMKKLLEFRGLTIGPSQILRNIIVTA